ncbi:MAG: ferric reductase-like transmembrane domain-containing protein [Azonexus sp.]|jgi:predicted ferric reductase|nr:ferric reductase-like transmembrane domain-containing protein [Azonexus sp.]
MKLLLSTIAAIVALAWGFDVATTIFPVDAHPLWIGRQEAMLLTGLLSIAMMSLAMLLATRPVWLEAPLGGMDRVYRTHKWAGILAGLFALAHWLIKESGSLVKTLIGTGGRLPKGDFANWYNNLRHLAEDMGEWAFYAIIALIVLTLWQRFPYKPWRFIHRYAMPALYLVLAFHAALLSPPDYWQQPVGALVAVMLLVGVYGAGRSLLGSIGESRQATGEIVSVEQPGSGLTAVTCRLRHGWRGHRPGQFAFVTFDAGEGAHPFTIASADRGDGSITFQIKALGDYTRQLATRLKPGQPVRIEGPYGCFDLARADRQAQQIWIAGGVGVTPFLAWLEALQADPAAAPAAELHYCTRDRDSDPFAIRLEQLAAGLPNIRLVIHGDRQGQPLDAQGLMRQAQTAKRSEVWFCGPSGLAALLRQKLRDSGGRAVPFHQEAFEMR